MKSETYAARYRDPVAVDVPETEAEAAPDFQCPVFRCWLPGRDCASRHLSGVAGHPAHATCGGCPAGKARASMLDVRPPTPAEVLRNQTNHGALPRKAKEYMQEAIGKVRTLLQAGSLAESDIVLRTGLGKVTLGAALAELERLGEVSSKKVGRGLRWSYISALEPLGDPGEEPIDFQPEPPTVLPEHNPPPPPVELQRRIEELEALLGSVADRAEAFDSITRLLYPPGKGFTLPGAIMRVEAIRNDALALAAARKEAAALERDGEEVRELARKIGIERDDMRQERDAAVRVHEAFVDELRTLLECALGESAEAGIARVMLERAAAMDNVEKLKHVRHERDALSAALAVTIGQAAGRASALADVGRALELTARALARSNGKVVMG